MTISSVTKELIGMPCWNVAWERHTNLGMQFGQPYLDIREPKEVRNTRLHHPITSKYRRVAIRGEWLFWIFYAYWQLLLPGEYAVTSRTSYKIMQQALIRLDGQRFQTITVNPTTGATIITFDLGAILRIRRIDAVSDTEMWSLYTPDKYVLCVRGNGTMSYQEETQKDVWIPIEM